MDAHIAETKTRQFFWGLSTGIVMLTVAGAFWLMLGVTSIAATWTPADKYPSTVDGAVLRTWGISILVLALVILAGAWRVRRKAAGFSRHDLRRPELAEDTRGIRQRFRWTSAAQFAGCALSVWLGMRWHREDLIWPGIALVVSLHFVPLGLVLRMRPYLATAAFGSALAALALALPVSLLPPAVRFVFIGAGMGVILWATALYVILRADRLALAWASSR
ncbi:MAG TPA: hypothetical protein VG736_08180 [Vicinamibacterales bacterium]|jgi:hypothetical protein|nr:hypothetical protein [Vicinamibacterales bacterium]